MVYIYDLMESFDDTCLEQALSMISLQRREQVLGIRNKVRQRQSVMAYLLLKYALEKEYQLTENPLFDFTDKGKPQLAEHPEIHFNLSHCANGVACIVGMEPVGIDIEKIGNYKPDLAAYISSPEEFDAIQKSGNPAENFTRLWTKKESYLKCTGIGLTDNLKEIFCHPVPYHFETMANMEKKYICTSCTEAMTAPDFVLVEQLPF